MAAAPGARILIRAKIARLHAPRRLAFEDEMLDPATLGPDEVLGETLCSALSVGTELAAYRGDPPLRPGPVYPRLVGYCNVARLTAVGANVPDYRTGQRVLSLQSHRSAFVCRAADLLLPVPESVECAAAAMTYLFYLAHNALQKAVAERVAVIGLGTIGLAAVALARATGAQVLAFSDQQSSRALAEEFGAQTAAKSSRVFAEAGLVLTTSNQWEDWRLALQNGRKGATLCVLGFPGRGLPPPEFNPLDSQYFYDKQLRLVACGMADDAEVKRDCAALLERIAAGALPARRLVDRIHPWHELGAVYEQLAQRPSGALTRVLDWRAQ